MKRFSSALPFSKKWSSGNSEIDRFLEEAKSIAEGSKLKHTTTIESTLNSQESSSTYLTTNKSLDFEKSLKWIPFNEFSNLVEIGKGGFGIVYSAIWHDAPEQKFDLIWNKKRVALKVLFGSNVSTIDLLNELKSHYRCMESFRVLHCYGVSQDPSTKNYILVMQYASEGNLQSYLDKSFTRFTWHQKINMLRDIVLGLKAIHSEYLIHCDLHSGNILRHGYGNDSDNLDTYISDIGLCHPIVDSKEKEKIFGVLPYIAPEVLRGDRYTKASDIYSLGIIMWEIASSEKPFMDHAHNEELAKDICNGLRPTIINNTPECYTQVMKQCWDANPLMRPTVENLAVIIKEFREVSDYKVQIMNAEYHRKVMTEKIFAGKVELKKKKHPEAIYSSRQFDFMDLPLPKNAPEPLSAQSDNNRALEDDNATTKYCQRQTISPTIPKIMSPKTRIQKIYSAKIKNKSNVNSDQ